MQSPWGVCVCIWQGQMLTGGPVWGEVDLEVQATQAELTGLSSAWGIGRLDTSGYRPGYLLSEPNCRCVQSNVGTHLLTGQGGRAAPPADRPGGCAPPYTP